MEDDDGITPLGRIVKLAVLLIVGGITVAMIVL